MPTSHFVVTPWRDAEELLELRRWFYDRDGRGGANEDRRARAVSKVLAWRVRRPELPLLLDCTADIVDAIVQDERGGLQHNACRLVYATAISRFVTGFTDTQLDLRRSRPTWNSPPPSTTPTTPFLDIPPHLLEVRHSIVHRQLPSLSVLRKAARQSLDWLWEWYWSHLDLALPVNKPHHDESHVHVPSVSVSGQPGYGGQEQNAEEPIRSTTTALSSSISTSTTHSGEVSTITKTTVTTPPRTQTLQDRIQTILKAYLRARKLEITGRSTSKTSKSAQNPPSTSTLAISDSAASTLALTSLLSLATTRTSSKPQTKTKTKTKKTTSEAVRTKDVSLTLLPLLLDNPQHAPQILPADIANKISSSASKTSGAFLLWTPLLVSLSLSPSLSPSSTSSSSSPPFLQALTHALLSQLSLPDTAVPPAVKHGLLEWILHICLGAEFAEARKAAGGVVDKVLETCFLEARRWDLRVAERLLESGEVVPNAEMWGVLLEAAREEEGVGHAAADAGEEGEEKEGVEMPLVVGMGEGEKKRGAAELEDRGGEKDVEMVDAEALMLLKSEKADVADASVPETEEKEVRDLADVRVRPSKKKVKVAASVVEEKTRGPQKWVGLWRPRPIGALPVGWEYDE